MADNFVNDESLQTSLYLSAALGTGCIAAFCLLQDRVQQYRCAPLLPPFLRPLRRRGPRPAARGPPWMAAAPPPAIRPARPPAFPRRPHPPLPPAPSTRSLRALAGTA